MFKRFFLYVCNLDAFEKRTISFCKYNRRLRCPRGTSAGRKPPLYRTKRRCNRASGCRRAHVATVCGAHTTRGAGSVHTLRTLERRRFRRVRETSGVGDDIIRCIKCIVLFTRGQRFREILHSIKRRISRLNNI